MVGEDDEPRKPRKSLAETLNDAFVIAAMIGLVAVVLAFVWYAALHNT